MTRAVCHTVRVPIAFVLLVLASGCGSESGQAAGGPPQMPPTPVDIATLQETDVADATEYVATLRSLKSTNVQSQTEGNIKAIRVVSGQRVETGTPLFEIDPERQQAEVQSEAADRPARVAAVAFARQELARMKDLHEAGIASRQQLDQAQTALETAEAELASLEAKVAAERVQLQFYTVPAPTEGVVGDIPVRVGMHVTPSTALTTIDQNATLELNVPVPVERAAGLKLGGPVAIVDEKGEAARSTFNFISPRVDTTTQTVLAKAMVSNPDGRLRSSQQVRARVLWTTAKGLVIPVTAVLRLSGQYFAFVAEEKEGQLVARQRPIRVGPIIGDDYTVTNGLKPAERIVVSGVQKLVDGAPIAPRS